MFNRRFKPLVDKMYWMISIPTGVLMLTITVLSAFAPLSLLVTVPTDLFVLYFLISPLFGYVELREETVFIKFGFILKREIPYSKIRGTEKAKKFYSDSMLSLKNSLEHVNIKFNTFDIFSVSVVGNDELIEAIEGIKCKR